MPEVSPKCQYFNYFPTNHQGTVQRLLGAMGGSIGPRWNRLIYRFLTYIHKAGYQAEPPPFIASCTKYLRFSCCGTFFEVIIVW